MTTYDSHQSPDSLRDTYYGVMYGHAFKLTGSDKPARKLADRVFRELEHRYASNPIRGHIDDYLAAQVYLSYAQKGLGDSDEGVEYEDILPEADDLSHIGIRPKAAPVIQMNRMPDPTTPVIESPVWENIRVAVAHAHVAASAAAPAEPPQTAEIRPGISESPPPLTTTPRGTRYYDKNSTIFWIPGLEDELPPKEDPVKESVEMFPDFEYPKPPLLRQSVFFSILNGLLALCCVAAIVFLLVELKILPVLF